MTFNIFVLHVEEVKTKNMSDFQTKKSSEYNEKFSCKLVIKASEYVINTVLFVQFD